MEKIVYLFFIVIGFYFIYNYCQKQTAETFENITLGSADDQNSINKLAQIANQLMTGGVTVPGNMNIQGEVNWSGNLPRFGPAENKFTLHTPPDARKGLWIAPSTDDANSNWAWDKALNLNRSGNHNLGGNLAISGELRGNMANDQENGLKLPYNVWIKSRSPADQDAYKILFYQDGRTYLRSGGGFTFRRSNDSPLVDINNDGLVHINGDLTVGGKISSKSGNRLTIIPTGQMWNDRGFIELMVRHFKKSDPDGTKIDFMLVHDNGSARFQSGVKYGNVMLRLYQTHMNGNDVGVWGPNPTEPWDVWRINLIQ